MLKPFVVSVALTSLGVSAVGADGQSASPATWRWHVTRILAAQDAEADPLATVGALDSRTFDQKYERYSAIGLPEPQTRSNAK